MCTTSKQVRVEVNSATAKPVDEIASQASGIKDQVQRLRYLRERVVLAPLAASGWVRLLSAETAAIGVMVLVIGLAILVWILK